MQCCVGGTSCEHVPDIMPTHVGRHVGGNTTILHGQRSCFSNTAYDTYAAGCLLLLQWVDDHTHIPTLTAFPKHIPIIAHPEAAERIRPLGFQSLTTIKPGQSMQICGDRLQLTATAGALVGPPWSARQNGFVLRVCYLLETVLWCSRSK